MYKRQTPVLDLKFDKLQENLIEGISEKESVDYETAICYFLIFTIDYLGYQDVYKRQF